MSRVFDTPRYKHQTLFKMLTHVRLFDSSIYDRLSCFGNKVVYETSANSTLYRLALFEAADGMDEVIKVHEFDDLDDSILFTRYSALSAVQTSRGKNPDYEYAVNIGEVYSTLVDYACEKKKKIWADSDATLRLTAMMYSGDITPDNSVMDEMLFDEIWVNKLSSDLCAATTLACRLGNNVMEAFTAKYKGVPEGKRPWKHAFYISRGFEGLRMRSMTPEIRESHNNLRNNVGARDFRRFIQSYRDTDEAPYHVRLLGANKAYRFQGVNILEYESDIFLLDYASTDQMHLVSKSAEGMYCYTANYRLIGNMGSPSYKDDLQKCVESAFKWIADSLRYSGYSEAIPRSMKQSVALLQNELHVCSEKLETGHERKSADMRTTIPDIVELPSYWHDFISKCKIPDRAKLDIGNMYYFIPAPDADICELFKRATVTMQKTRSVNPTIWRKFMNYTKSLDFCKVLTKEKKVPAHRRVEGYECESDEWFEQCLKGTICMPPDEDLGKIWLYGHFPFNNTINSWYWEAGDVTRIESDIKVYDDQYAYTRKDRNSTNELLYALKKAPLLSGNRNPSEILSAIQEGNDKWDRVAELAAKCENTKPGKKVRETWSADDITREVTSCFDRSAIPLSMMYRGVTSRRGNIHVQGIFDDICGKTRPDQEASTVIVSNDVSGWSPSADREAWTEHHDYVLHTTQCPEDIGLNKVWKGMQATIAKRGYLATCKLPRGLFQGWTGTMDTLLNVRLSLYCLKVAKEQGFMGDGESSITAGLIDDAVQAIVMAKDRTPEEKQIMADRHFQTTCDTWQGAAAKIDEVKTMYSTIKFIFLNRLFCEGSEVVQPAKIYARCDKEYNRRFASIFDQVDTVFGSFRSSVERGACPISAYKSAMVTSVRLCLLTNRVIKKVSSIRLINAAFAPRGLGGWGFPTFGAFITQECRDHLASYVCLVGSLLDHLDQSEASASLNSCFEATMQQEFSRRGILDICASPYEIHAVGVPNPSATIISRVKARMCKEATSPVFQAALSTARAQLNEEIFGGILRHMTVDAAILEMLHQCLPESCMAALIDRALRNELVTCFFPYQTRTMLSKAIINGGRKAVEHLLTLPGRPTVVGAIHGRRDAYSRTESLRCDFYEFHGMIVTNHTYPDPMMSLARQLSADSASMNVDFGDLEKPCPKEGYPYTSLYESVPRHAARNTIMTSSPYIFNGNQFKSSTPVQRCLQRGAIVAAYLQDNGKNGKVFWDMVCASWGCPSPLEPPLVTRKIKDTVSTKRITTSMATRTHSITCFKNSQGFVQVEGTRLGRYLSATNTRIDYMSYITSAKAVALMEVAAADSVRDVRVSGLHYAFLPDSLPPHNKDIFDINSEYGFQCAYSELFSHPDAVLSTSFIDAATTSLIDDEVNDDIRFTRIVFGERNMDSLVDEHIVEVGVLTNIIRLGSTAAMASEKKSYVSREEIRAGEYYRSLGQGIDKRFRDYCAIVDEQDAVLILMTETIRQQIGDKPNYEVLGTPWKSMSSVFESAFPIWDKAYINTMKMAKSFVTGIDMGKVSALLGRAPVAVRTQVADLVSSLTESNRAAALQITSTLYNIAFGRANTPETYRLMAATGRSYIKKCWRLAGETRKRTRRADQEDFIRRILGHMYIHISNNVLSTTHRTALAHEVMRSLHQAALLHDRSPCDCPDYVPSLTIEQYSDIVRTWVSAFSQSLGCYGDAFSRPVDEVLGDIEVLDVRPTHREVPLAQVGFPAMQLSALSHLDFGAPVQDAGMVVDETDETAAYSSDIINATKLYRIYGEDGALLAYRERMFDGYDLEDEDEPTEEEIADFMELLAAHHVAVSRARIRPTGEYENDRKKSRH